MSSHINHRRKHGRIQDGGPHGSERKRWAVGFTKRKHRDRKRARAQQRLALAGKSLPPKAPRKRFRISGRDRERY